MCFIEIFIAYLIIPDLKNLNYVKLKAIVYGKTERFAESNLAQVAFIYMRTKTSNKRPKCGRPKIDLTKKQKDLAVQYVKTSGLWKDRLAKYLGVSRKTLYRILKRDQGFDTALQAADAVFCAEIIKKAKPDFILKTKHREEFIEKIVVEESVDKKLKEFLDRVSKKLP